MQYHIQEIKYIIQTSKQVTTIQFISLLAYMGLEILVNNKYLYTSENQTQQYQSKIFGLAFFGSTLQRSRTNIFDTLQNNSPGTVGFVSFR
jgi:hypothetical protein